MDVHVIQSLSVDLSLVRRIARECQTWLLIPQMKNVSFVYAEGASNSSTAIQTISVILDLAFLDFLIPRGMHRFWIDRTIKRAQELRTESSSLLFLSVSLFFRILSSRTCLLNVKSSRQSEHSKSLWTGLRCIDVLTRYKGETTGRRDTERFRTKMS